MSQRSSLRKSHITKEELAKLWGISLESANQTLRVTTQKGIRNAIHPIVRRYATKQSRLRYNQLGSRHGRFYSDTFFSNQTSVRGNTMAQLFVNDIKYLRIMPMRKKSEAGSALLELIQDIGIPSVIHTDGAKELTQGKWKNICDDFGIKQTITEPYSPWQNRAELNIREAKKKILRLMTRTNTPKALWDYCATYVADITCYTANDIYVLHGRTPHEMVTGNTPDITEYTEFSWYEPIYYYDDLPFPEAKRNIARWLGVAHRVGQALCYWILTNNGQVIARTTIQKLSNEEQMSPVTQDEIRSFDLQIANHLSPNSQGDDELFNLQDIACDEPLEPDSSMPEQDDFPDNDTYDQYITAQVLLPRGDTYEKGTVLRRKRDKDGTLIGHANMNPILNTRVFEVIFPDGHVAEYATNVIAENMFAMVDDEGYETAIIKSIIDHRCDHSKALREQEAWITSYNGNRTPRYTTKGWDLCVEWQDGSTSWIPLKDLKVANPIETAEYAIAHNLSKESAFSWWVRDVLKHRDRIIAASNTRYVKHTHKFGIELPKTVEEALDIDRKTCTTYWYDAIQKEMRNNAIAFEFLEPGESIPIGYTKLPFIWCSTLKLISHVKHA
jgi:transposase